MESESCEFQPSDPCAFCKILDELHREEIVRSTLRFNEHPDRKSLVDSDVSIYFECENERTETLSTYDLRNYLKKYFIWIKQNLFKIALLVLFLILICCIIFIKSKYQFHIEILCDNIACNSSTVRIESNETSTITMITTTTTTTEMITTTDAVWNPL